MTVMGKHGEWRKIAKKLRRKRIRQQKAKERDEQLEREQREKEKSVEYQIWAAEQEKMEVFRRSEEERIHEEEHEKWLRTELLAQQQWRQLQEKILKARLERAEQDLRIKKEWEEEQRKIKVAEEERKRLEAERLQQHQELMRKIELFVSGAGELPSELLIGRESNPGKEICPFFYKTGACRFSDGCSRNHKYPGVSKVLLATNFYTNFGMEHSRQNEHGDDITLEFDDKDTYQHFEEFFNDVVPEFQRIGKLVQFKVCSNYEKHLRGNTYVEYSSLPEAMNAYRTFHGRWYGGKQMSLKFCEILSWKSAICGLFADRKCPKGRSCNFLHVFRNPGNMFRDVDQRHTGSRSDRGEHRTHSRYRRREENWRWSETPIRATNIVEKCNGRDERSRRRSHDKRKCSKSRNTSNCDSARRRSIRDKRHSSRDRYDGSVHRRSHSRDKLNGKRSRSKENRSSSRHRNKDTPKKLRRSLERQSKDRDDWDINKTKNGRNDSSVRRSEVRSDTE